MGAMGAGDQYSSLMMEHVESGRQAVRAKAWKACGLSYADPWAAGELLERLEVAPKHGCRREHEPWRRKARID